jgi:hypothetical protein
MNATRDFWIIPHENRTHPGSTRSNRIEAAFHRRYKFADDTATKKPSELGVLPVRSLYFDVAGYEDGCTPGAVMAAATVVIRVP